jgi:hypothetical protein
MNRRLLTGFSLVGVVVALLWGRGLFRQAASHAESVTIRDKTGIDITVDGDEKEVNTILLYLGYPDTTSKHWKRLSKDVGLEIREDAHYTCLRARLFVRDEGRWVAVGIDGPEDIQSLVLAR